MDKNVLVAVIGLVLGGGGLAFIKTVLSGWSTIRSGGVAREREALDYVARSRDDAEQRTRETEQRLRVSDGDRYYFQRTMARYSAQLLAAGIEPDPASPVPPSERAAD